MTHVLAIGTGPLYGPEVRIFTGQSLRTWHFTAAMTAAGHEVDLVVLPTEGQPPPEPDAPPALLPRERRGFAYRLVNSTDPGAVLPLLQQALDTARHQAIVAVNHNAAWPAVQLATRLPVWADLNGTIMGEAQARAAVYESDDCLIHFWRRERAILRRADRLSAVSHKQMLATIGELGAVGRLNRHTAAHAFVCSIPNAAAEEFLEIGAAREAAESVRPPPTRNPNMHKPATSPRFRGDAFPANAFAVLWSGGFNAWTDVRLLTAALSLAMEMEPRLRFVATGGPIPGHDERTFETFRSEMAQAGLLDRCHLLGWIEGGDLLALYGECDLGINIDGRNYETLLGARNRITNMVAAGLPVLTTLGSEVTEDLDDNRLAYVIELGDVGGLCDAMVRAARHPDECRDNARRARRFCIEKYSYAATCKPLLDWLNTGPALAPDNDERARLRPDLHHLETCTLNDLDMETMAAATHDLPALVRAGADLDAIRSKPLYRLYKRLFGRKKSI